ncbi:uncharacterized protein V1518DRAFT_419335 [Limtongia smithiae]|uniref:uncharacterized protein n=1 Tax=Limtongia smithiae TaxID=1125753 RepID=UPI0034CD6102
MVSRLQDAEETCGDRAQHDTGQSRQFIRFDGLPGPRHHTNQHGYTTALAALRSRTPIHPQSGPLSRAMDTPSNTDQLRAALRRIGAQLLPMYDDNTTSEEEIVLYRATEAAWTLWLTEQKIYAKWNTHKKADYRKENKRIQAGALDFKYVYLCNHAKKYTSQHNPTIPFEKQRRGKETIKVGCHAKIVARQYTDSDQIEIRYRWRHNGHLPPVPLDILRKREARGIHEWLMLRVGQLYTTEEFMDLVRFSTQDIGAFESSPAEMAGLPEIFRVLKIRPMEVYAMVREQLAQSATWPDNASRKLQIWQDLCAEGSSTMELLTKASDVLDKVALSGLWEHLSTMKAANRRLREILLLNRDGSTRPGPTSTTAGAEEMAVQAPQLRQLQQHIRDEREAAEERQGLDERGRQIIDQAPPPPPPPPPPPAHYQQRQQMQDQLQHQLNQMAQTDTGVLLGLPRMESATYYHAPQQLYQPLPSLPQMATMTSTMPALPPPQPVTVVQQAQALQQMQQQFLVPTSRMPTR